MTFVELTPHDDDVGLPDEVTTLRLNYLWRRYVADALEAYFVPAIGNDFENSDTLTTYNNFLDLLLDLYTVETPSMQIPVGAIICFPFSAWTFDGYLPCDGQHYLTADYPDLEAVIDANFKDATGFFTPNIRERVIVDYAAAGIATAIGQTAGAATHTLAIGEIPAHSHNVVTPVTSGAGTNNGRVARGDGSTAGTFDSHTEASAGSGTAHNNLQPYIVLKHLIKAVSG